MIYYVVVMSLVVGVTTQFKAYGLSALAFSMLVGVLLSLILHAISEVKP